MAALILGAGALAYDQVQKGRARRKARRDHNSARFSELERENAERIAGLPLQQEEAGGGGGTCFCERCDWTGRGSCPEHGDIGVMGGGRGGEQVGRGEREGGRRREEPPAYVDVTGGGERGRRISGEEGGEVVVGGEEGRAGQGQRRAPETEVERLRINEERRKIMRKDKGYRRLFGKKKGGQEAAIA